jgi:DUF1009 family protein
VRWSSANTPASVTANTELSLSRCCATRFSGSRELAAQTGAQIGASAAARLEFHHLSLKDSDRIKSGKLTIRVLETPRFLGPLLVPAGRLTRRGPTAREQQDIVLGREIARQIAALRIGQTVVLKHGTVLAVESVEGTDAAIRRGGELGRGGVVVVKVSRPDQDLRFDLPTVGPETLSALREASATALALDAGRTLLLDRDRFVAGAEELDLAVVAD